MRELLGVVAAVLMLFGVGLVVAYVARGLHERFTRPRSDTVDGHAEDVFDIVRAEPFPPVVAGSDLDMSRLIHAMHHWDDDYRAGRDFASGAPKETVQ